MAALRLEYLDPSELADNGKNYRRHPAHQITALKGVLSEVGWAGALLYNETTQHLIDGHARKQVTPSGERVPVLIGSWSEAEEALILATLDPLAAMAEADAEVLAALLREVSTNDTALQQMLADLAEGAGITPPDENEWGAALGGLPSGEKAPFQQMTFTLSDAQTEIVRSALSAAKKHGGEFAGTGNENSNGNALARLAEVYLG